mgnify:CR=1
MARPLLIKQVGALPRLRRVQCTNDFCIAYTWILQPGRLRYCADGIRRTGLRDSDVSRLGRGFAFGVVANMFWTS